MWMFIALAAATVPELALRDTAPPRSVYRLNLAVDVPVTLGGAAAAVARMFLKDKLARISCPCDASGLNFIDRGTVSNSSSHAANVISDVTVALAMAAPPVADAFDLGFSRALGEDL